jgi:hypothetical protein
MGNRTTGPARARPASLRARQLVGWVAVTSLLSVALLAPSGAAAAEVAPNADYIQLVAGNPTCLNNQFYSFKIDGVPTDGLWPAGTGVIEISNATDYSFDWALTPDYLHAYDINAVIVKGGDNAYVYYYFDPGDDNDTNLQSPPSSGGPQALISHVEFCFDQKGTPNPRPTPTPTPEPTPTPTPEPTPTPTPTPEPTPTPTPEPTPTPTPEPTPTPTPEPTPTPTPTPEPTPTPTPVPTPTATPVPTPTATPVPTGEVAGATGVPRITPPPTDAGPVNSAPAPDTWRIALVLVASSLAGALILMPSRRRVRR